MSDADPFSLPEPLTERETQILHLLADGLTNREIAARLHLSYETIKWYNKQIYGKLGVSNRTQAASLALDRGYLGKSGAARASPGMPPNNLPAPITPFVGRSEMVGGIAQLVRQENHRLVTLTGPGGIGKTRLGLEVAKELMPAFPDGTYLVNLWKVLDPDRVAEAIATSLGLDLPSQRSTQEALTKHLQERRMLLLLDSFEHVVEEAPLLLELLTAAGDLRILVTSRQPLHLYGEVHYPVPPLALPDPAETAPNLDPLEFEAVALFAQCARAAQPSIRFSGEDASFAAEICSQLDGLPLAIELAAARLKRLSLLELQAQLERSLSTLEVAANGVPERQRTLQATFEWSFDLLEYEEKSLFGALSVFRGGFTLDAAKGVLEATAPATIENGVESLVDKSLLLRDSRSGAQSRFRMLDVLREYAEHIRPATHSQHELARRHAEYYARLAEDAATQFGGPEQTLWLGRLASDYENLRAALDWAFGEGDPILGLRLVAALGDYWFFQGPGREALHWAQVALDNLEEASPSLQANVKLRASHALMHHGRMDRARSLLNDALEVFRAEEDPWHTAWSLASLSFTFIGQPETHDLAIGSCEEGLALFRSLGSQRGMAAALTIQSKLAMAQGDLDKAEEAAEESLQLSRLTGNRRREGLQLLQLGMIAQSRNDPTDAEKRLRQSLILSREIGFDHLTAIALAAMAGPLTKGGKASQAATLLGASAAYRERSGTSLEAIDEPVIEEYGAATLDELGDSAYQEAIAQGRRLDPQAAIAFALGEETE